MRVTITTMQPPDIRMPAVNRHEGHACIIFTPKEVYHLQLSYKYTVCSHACVLLNLAPFFSEILYLTDSAIILNITGGFNSAQLSQNSRSS